MKILDFNRTHMEEARELARMNYEEERVHVPALPKVETLPGLEHFADNGLGVAAYEGDRMLGFLGVYIPTEDHFGSTGIRGTFSPIHAHGVLPTELLQKGIGKGTLSRDRIYSRLYEEAAKKWVEAGIRSHAIAFYTHDNEAIRSFFYNGFGLRCIDAIRTLSEPIYPTAEDTSLRGKVSYFEVPKDDWKYLLEHNNRLIAHLGQSPTFMKFDCIDENELYRRSSEHTRYFAARDAGGYLAYLKISETAENFVTEDKGMMNISGAYCKPEYRGTGIFHNLLCNLTEVLKNEGYCLLGVDCESFNPNARGFWLKYFAEYTHSVVRRIDDRAFE